MTQDKFNETIKNITFNIHLTFKSHHKHDILLASCNVVNFLANTLTFMGFLRLWNYFWSLTVGPDKHNL